jgi:hypothetical protein
LKGPSQVSKCSLQPLYDKLTPKNALQITAVNHTGIDVAEKVANSANPIDEVAHLEAAIAEASKAGQWSIVVDLARLLAAKGGAS